MSFIEQVEAKAKIAGLYPLRPSQVRALTSLAAGTNLLVIWPTGSGKSLCYQLPSQVWPGLTLVVSPLIALMEDQVAAAKKRGWSATCIHSGLDREERTRRLEAVRNGQISLLYVTPERFRQEEFVATVVAVGVRLLAVDEAHCISQWGHDFRPDYTRLGQIRKLLGEPQVLALTATATRVVQQDIWVQLGLGDAPGETAWEGVERPNLHLEVRELEDGTDKPAAVLEWLGQVQGPKIIYFTLIGTLEKQADRLRAKGVAFTTYHGDMQDRARARSLREFLDGSAELMLATPAFGLGVDKADVRGVLHFEIPGSLEAYFQEVGRAGRDGAPAHCRLLYVQDDLEIQMGFIDSLTPEPAYLRAVHKLLVDWRDRLASLEMDDLRAQLSFKNKRDYRLETALNALERLDVLRWPHRQLRNLVLLRELAEDDLSESSWKARRLELHKKLMALVEWIRSPKCRKVVIYQYFGWDNATPCGFCDRCESP